MKQSKKIGLANQITLSLIVSLISVATLAQNQANPKVVTARRAGGGMTGSGSGGHKDGFLSFTDTTVCDQCPKGPISADPGITFDQAGQIYASGITPTSDQLEGKWWLVLQVIEPSAFKDLRIDLELSDGYDPIQKALRPLQESYEDENGILNRNGRILEEISFSHSWSTSSSPFLPSPSLRKFEYKILNDYAGDGKAQGPFEAEFHNGSVCISQYSYIGWETLNKNASYDYQCRLLSTNSNLMICQVSPQETERTADQAFDNYVGKTIKYVGFARE